LRDLRSLVHEGRSDAPGRLVDVLGRIGLAGYGVVHLLVAWLALEVALGVPDAPADAEGAIGTIAPHSWWAARARAGRRGAVRVRAVAGLGGRRRVQVGRRRRARPQAGGAIAKAIAMSALAILIADYLLDVGSAGGTTAQTVAAGVLAFPAGRVLLGLGAGTILVGSTQRCAP
jgi:hypothetical protein